MEIVEMVMIEDKEDKEVKKEKQVIEAKDMIMKEKKIEKEIGIIEIEIIIMNMENKVIDEKIEIEIKKVSKRKEYMLIKQLERHQQTNKNASKE